MKTPQRVFSSGRRAAGGFTLMEVLVALMIFALMAIVLGSAYVNVLNSYAVAARGNQANEEVAFARAQMLAEPDRKVIEQGGDYETSDNRRVRWSTTIASTAINDLFTVTFVCELTPSGKSELEKITETFTVLRPTWSDAAERSKLFQDATSRITELQGKNQR